MCANHFRISYTYISYMSCNAAHTYNNHAMYATNQIDISSALTMNVAMNEQRPYLMSYIYSAAAATTEKMEETVGHR